MFNITFIVVRRKFLVCLEEMKILPNFLFFTFFKTNIRVVLVYKREYFEMDPNLRGGSLRGESGGVVVLESEERVSILGILGTKRAYL